MNVGQVDPGEPAVRQAGRHRARHAGRDPRPRGAARQRGEAGRSRSWTPAATSPAAGHRRAGPCIQAEIAAERADVIVFVVDAETGIQEEDAALAQRLRR